MIEREIFRKNYELHRRVIGCEGFQKSYETMKNKLIQKRFAQKDY